MPEHPGRRAEATTDFRASGMNQAQVCRSTCKPSCSALSRRPGPGGCVRRRAGRDAVRPADADCREEACATMER
ncbi:hypothetical protein GCM10023082_24740 [Streptomyces tremellae]|uniref:Uncharacterized protein n=1 Tax=Streptomyces tremellae TaxID=1124239 RepID=A0ABP7EWC0_9ACTN